MNGVVCNSVQASRRRQALMRRHAQSMSLEAMEERRLRDRSRTRQVLGGEEGVADMVQVANKQVQLKPPPSLYITTKSGRREV